MENKESVGKWQKRVYGAIIFLNIFALILLVIDYTSIIGKDESKVASIGTTTPDKSSAWFLNQLTPDEYLYLQENQRLSDCFLYVGRTDCPYCLEFVPYLQQALIDLDMLDDVRAWDTTMYNEGGNELKKVLGVDTVPALLEFTPDGGIRHLVIDFDNLSVQGIINFLQ